jgi:hypothetical protein
MTNEQILKSGRIFRRRKFFKEPKEEPFGKHTILEDPDGHLSPKLKIAHIIGKADPVK